MPGSVSFLHSGALLHAILPRSNCWCVDGVSKFAMRVLPDTYYRIELPGETPEDLEKVEECKETLKKVLFYERTPCPFARTFTVDLPDEQPIARKKSRKSHGPAKKWKLDRAYSWKPEDGRLPDKGDDADGSSGSIVGSDDDGSSNSTDDIQSESSETADKLNDLSAKTPSKPSVRERARGFNLRSITAPPQLSLQSTPPSRLRTSAADGAADVQPDRGDPNTAPLRPFQAIPTDMPPSPPDSSAGLESIEPNAPNTILEQAAATVTRQPPTAQWETTPGPEVSHPAPNESEASPGFEAHGDVHAPLDFVGPTGVKRSEAGAREQSEVSDRNSKQEPLAGHKAALSPDTSTAAAAASELDKPQPELEPESPKRRTSASMDEPVDPFAEIQARIQMRRSIGTTTFVPGANNLPSHSLSSTASSGSLTSTKSNVSKRSHTSQQQQAFATAMVRKACAAFLGPPAHLVAIMLRIAARFARGAFPSVLLFESPVDMPKRVPGSFDLDGSDVEDVDPDVGADWDEDDFGVPLHSPVRKASARSFSGISVPTMKGRKAWVEGE